MKTTAEDHEHIHESGPGSQIIIGEDHHRHGGIPPFGDLLAAVTSGLIALYGGLWIFSRFFETTPPEPDGNMVRRLVFNPR